MSSEPKIMGKPRSEPPTEWSPFTLQHVEGSEDIYVHVGADVKPGDKGSEVLIYHWHTPSEGAHRWAASYCGLHDVVSVEPLHLERSLACENGCPSHGWIRDGRWTNA